MSWLILLRSIILLFFLYYAATINTVITDDDTKELRARVAWPCRAFACFGVAFANAMGWL